MRADAAGGRPTTYPLDSSQFSFPALSTSTSVDTVGAGARVDMQGTSPPGGGEAGNVHDMYLVAGCQSRDWELQESVQARDKVDSVQGRLKAHQQFWRVDLEAPPFALGIVQHGYVLPLKSAPIPFSRPNQLSAQENVQFVTRAVLELLQKRCVREVPLKPHGCHPLAVVTSGSGKLRLVINLRHLNKCLWAEKFKYEDLRVAMQFFERGDYLFTFDLKSGYHHVDIVEEHWKYLGFQWNIEGTSRYFVFCVLPFGLSTACYAFTELLRPLVKYWRGQGLRITVYLDDGICVAKGYDAAGTASAKVQDTLGKAEFVANVEKSMWQPAHQGRWLGFMINLALGEITVPSEKIDALKALLGQAVNAKELPARFLARITGKIISMSLTLGPVARFMTRSLYGLLDTRLHWGDILPIPAPVADELQFWYHEISGYNNQPI